MKKNIITDSTMAFINGRVNLINRELNDVEGNIQNFKQNNNIADIEEQSKVIIDKSADYYKQLNDLEVQENVITASLQYVMDEKNNKRPMPAITTMQDPNFVTLLQKYNSLEVQRDQLSLSNTLENPRLQNLDVQLYNLRKRHYQQLKQSKKPYKLPKKNCKTEKQCN